MDRRAELFYADPEGRTPRLQPAVALAIAVIERAVLDARAGCPDAQEFLNEGDEDLAFWCEMIGIDPNRLRDCWTARQSPVAD